MDSMISITNVKDVIVQIVSSQVFDVQHPANRSLLFGDLKTDLNFTSIFWEDKCPTVLPSGNTKSVTIFIFVSKFLTGHRSIPNLIPNFKTINLIIS